MKITVSNLDILQGKRRDILDNPIALSLKRIFPNHEIRVNLNYIKIGGEIIHNKIELYDFLYYWDGGYVVKPFEFEIDIPPKISLDF